MNTREDWWNRDGGQRPIRAANNNSHITIGINQLVAPGIRCQAPVANVMAHVILANGNHIHIYFWLFLSSIIHDVTRETFPFSFSPPQIYKVHFHHLFLFIFIKFLKCLHCV